MRINSGLLVVGTALALSAPVVAQQSSPAPATAPSPAGNMAPAGPKAPAPAASAQGSALTVTLAPQNGSNESGTATLTQTANGLLVSLQLSGAPSNPQPAHIHKGTCAKLDPKPAYPLKPVTPGQDAQGNAKGLSSTLLSNVTLDDLTKGTYAINVHKSVAEINTYVACGDIKNANPTGTSQ